jgi:demethylmenaquinone methyltransferase/2-methoxy-6-polyprenyl-1,4-benzoquinol methylase
LNTIRGKRDVGVSAETGRQWTSRVGSHRIFDRISSRYDLLNHLLSLGQDIRWRREVAVMIGQSPHRTILDLACGTCDLILSAFKYNRDIQMGIGIDMAEKMLTIGRDKVSSRRFNGRIWLVRGDGLQLPLDDNSIDLAVVSFGIRNMPDPIKALYELFRVLRRDGRLLVLEFSIPGNQAFRAVYILYFRHLLPLIGGLISGDRAAYSYLNRTVETFPYGEAFRRMAEAAGFANIRLRPLSLGIATIYCGDKP